MRCLYCYERDKTSTYSWDEVKALIDNIVEHNRDGEFTVEYLGGEPMLAFDLIRKATSYLEEIAGVEVHSYDITTNGTIAHDELIAFMRWNPKVSFHASMDGTKFMNSLRITKGGVNSHDLVMQNLDTLAAHGLAGRTSVHMVTHPYNVAYLARGVDHLYSQGIRCIGVGTVESTIRIGKEYCDRFVSELDAVSERIHQGHYPGLFVDVLHSLKPLSDTRHYIRDGSGKIIAETYGRTRGDITQTSVYNSAATSSPIGDLITDLRETVYHRHQARLKGVN